MRKNLLVIYGGNSSEHDISVITAVEALDSVARSLYKVIPIYVKDGEWYTGKRLFEISEYVRFDGTKCDKAALINGKLYRKSFGGAYKAVCKADAALLCLHGGEGENGAMQGLLELQGVPYTSSNVLSSAICMDKQLTKLIADTCSIKTVDCIVLDLPFNPDSLVNAEKELNYPMIVKPNDQGSSIGISFVSNRKELERGITLAGSFTKRVLIERALVDFKEYNIAAYRTPNGLRLSQIECPLTGGRFLSFDDKYGDNGGKKGVNVSTRQFPAEIDAASEAIIRSAAETLYNKLSLFGVVRFDFMKDKDGVYFNEVNTIPGALAHYLFPNITYTQMLNEIIDLTISRGAAEKIKFETDVLSHFKGFLKK